ncbi:RHS repeat-associated core domain-containing protein [Stenotrophomonas sp. PD6]|uniref:RHS repeat-associated core domain-containing protein n=1 Tax=Stenotrophomonas sp. PD6 TaxID=3368612 RepID=UPI003B9FF0A5
MSETNLMNHLNDAHIQVDPRSGLATGRISIARLVGNNRVGPTFDVDLVYRGPEEDWHLAMTRIRRTVHQSKPAFEITLASGATFIMTGTRMTSPTFVINIERLGAVIYHRDGTVESFKEVGPEPSTEKEDSDFKFIPDKYNEQREAYRKRKVDFLDSMDGEEYVLESITTPFGHQLKFEWRIWHEDRRLDLPTARHSFYRLHSIKDDTRTLLEFDGDHLNRPAYFKLFPGGGADELKYSMSFLDLPASEATCAALYQYGDGKRTRTTLTPDSFNTRLASISVDVAGGRKHKREIEYDQGALKSIKASVSATATTSETVSRTGGKVVSLERKSIEGMKGLTTRYTYAGPKDSAVFTAETDDAAKTKVVKYFNAAGRQTKEEVTAYGVTWVVEQDISFDDQTGRTIGKTIESLEGQAGSEVTVKWEMDTDGNLLQLEKDGLVTEYTYCTTLHHMKQSIEAIKVSNNDFWSYLFYPVDEALWASGTDRGLTWGKEEKRFISKESKGYSPGKELYNLPVPLSYPGERCGFDRFVESEVIYRRGATSASFLQAKFYSYKAVKPKRAVGAESLTDGDTPAIEKVLTVLEPELEQIDSFNQRYAALIAAGDDMEKWADELFRPGAGEMDTSSIYGDEHIILGGNELGKALDQVGGLNVLNTLHHLKEPRFQQIFVGLVEASEVRKDNLKELVPIMVKRLEGDYKSLQQQARRNSLGWKLKSHKGTMTVETFEYSAAPADYGLPSRIELHLINGAGEKVKDSKVETLIRRAYLPDGFAVTTEIKSEDGAKSVTTMKCSSLTGRVLNEGSPSGSTGPAENAAAVPEASHRTVYDDLGRQTEEQMVRQGKTHVLSTIKYDDHGRVAEQSTFDYLANGDKLTEHTIVSSYDENGNRTVVRTLRDGKGEEIDTLTDVYTTTPGGLTTLTRGKSVFNRQHDAAKRTVTEWEEKAFPYLKTVTTSSVEGWLKKIEYFSVTAKDKEALLAHRTLEHDAAGRCTKVSQTGSQDRTWQYDAFGRATQLVSGDVTVKNTYPIHTAAAVATQASLSAGASKVELGTQQCDGLGRVSALQVKGLAETMFSYADGGMNWGRDSSVADPKCLFYKTLGGSTPLPDKEVKTDPKPETKPEVQTDVHPLFSRIPIRITSYNPKDPYFDNLDEALRPNLPELEIKFVIQDVVTKHDELPGAAPDILPIKLTSPFDRELDTERDGGLSSSPALRDVETAQCGQFSSTLDLASLTYSETYEGLTSESTYSLRGSLVQFKDIAGNTTRLTYDLRGMIGKINAADVAEATFEYDIEGRILTETIRCLSAAKDMVVTFAYDAMGNEIKRTFTCDGFDTITIDRALLSDGRLKKSTLNVKDVERRSDSYQYHDGGRLKDWSCSDEEAFGPGSAGFTRQEFTYDTLGNVTEIAGDSAEGDVTRRFEFSTNIPGALAKGADDRGRDVECGDHKITYHPNGQVKGYDGSSSDSSYEFQYDDFGCIRGTVHGDCREIYHYRGNRIYARQRVDKSGSTAYGYHDRTIIVMSETSGCLLQQIHTKKDLAGEAVITTSFELRDAEGSIFASYDLSTNTVTYFSYTPYGYRKPGNDGVTWLGFKGEPLNPLGLYHLGNGYRLYDPQSCRFQSPDSWSPFGWGGANRYSYCGSDPVNHRDPRGHRIEVWSERRSLEDPILNDPLNIVCTVANIASIALAPFTGGSSVVLRIAAGVVATAMAGVSTVSMVIQNKRPELSAFLDGLTLVTGRRVDGMMATLSRSLKPLARGAVRSKNMKLLDTLGDGVDVVQAGLLANSLKGLWFSADAPDGDADPAGGVSKFLGGNGLASQDAPQSVTELPVIPVDPFLASCTPLQDAIARKWATQDKIDVAAVFRAYMLSAGTLTMENRGPLAAGNKMFNDLAMYGVHYTDPDGMYCRGNSPGFLAEETTGFRPFA